MNVKHCCNYTDIVRPKYWKEKTCPNHVKKNQLEAQLILSIFCQPLHVLGISRPIIRRYNCMYTTVGTYYSFQMTVCCSGWIGTIFERGWMKDMTIPVKIISVSIFRFGTLLIQSCIKYVSLFFSQYCSDASYCCGYVFV